MLVRTADLPFPRATTTNYYRVLLLLELVPADEMMVQTGSSRERTISWRIVTSRRVTDKQEPTGRKKEEDDGESLVLQVSLAAAAHLIDSSVRDGVYIFCSRHLAGITAQRGLE